MKCANCGNELQTGDVFCQACGVKVANAPEQPAPDRRAPAPAATQEPMDETGEGTQFGPYLITELLGRRNGIMVWRALDTVNNRQVMVREPFFVANMDPHTRERNNVGFVQAGQEMLGLYHPNIVATYAADFFDGRPAVVTELVEGQTLSKWRYPVSIEAALDVLGQLLNGLEYAHKNGISHRGIKPTNIYVDDEGSVKLANFRFPYTDPQGKNELGVGPIGYLAPEQVQGAPGDERSDIFSLAVVGYEMLAGRHPFAYGGADDDTVRDRILNKEVANPSLLRDEELPQHICNALLKALKKDPAKRPPNTSVFRSMLGIKETEPAPQAQPQPAPIMPPISPSQTSKLPKVAAQQGPQNVAIPTYPAAQPSAPVAPVTPRPNRTPYIIAAFACVIAAIAVIVAVSGGAIGLPGGNTASSTNSQTSTASSTSGSESAASSTSAASSSTSTSNTTTKPTATEPVKPKGQYPPRFTGASASSTLPNEYYAEYGTLDYAPHSAIDNNVTTGWNAYHSSRLGVGESITLTASTEQLVKGVDIVNGYPLTNNIYVSNPRPRELEVQLSDGYTATLSLSDLYRSSQRFDFGGEHSVTSMKFTVKSVYDPSMKDYDTVCIAEITAF